MSGTWRWPTYWLSLAAFSLLAACWGLATPLFAVPDEPAHFLKSAGVVRGQLAGIPESPTGVRVPPALQSTRLQTGCFVLQPAVPASCAPGYDGPGGEDVVAYTQAGRYPPVYYAAVGWPTLLWTDLEVVYAVRGVSAALCAALLAAAVTSAAASGRRPLVLGVAVAATPMAAFLCSSVNPSGPEIAAATALWTAGLVLATGAGDRVPRPVLATAGAAAVVLCLSRPVSPFWAALIGGALAVVAGRRRCLELLRTTAVRWWLAALVLAGAAQSLWVLLAGSLQLYGNGRGDTLTLADRVLGSVSRTDDRAREMVGWFGWLDAPAPGAVHLAWGLALLAVVAAGLRGAHRGRALLLAALAAAVVVVPVVLEVPGVDDTGYYWQGRYTLPLAVGLPLLAGVLSSRPRELPRPAVALLLAVLAVCHAVGFVVALGRYTVGTGNGLGLLDVVWSPPLPALLLAVAAALASTAWVAVGTARARAA